MVKVQTLKGTVVSIENVSAERSPQFQVAFSANSKSVNMTCSWNAKQSELCGVTLINKKEIRVQLPLDKAGSVIIDGLYQSALQQYEAAQIAEYANLVANLPVVVLPVSNKILSDAEVISVREEIASKQKMLNGFRGEEDDGIRMSIIARIRTLEKEIRGGCAHSWAEKIERGLDLSAHRKVIRTHTCEKCGMVVTATVHEALTDAQIWR